MPAYWRSTGRGAGVVGRALVIVCGAALLAAEGDEGPPRLRAADVLPASQLKGPHHAVADAVTTPAFFHQFTLTSAYGTFTAEGRSEVPVRASEIEALASLDEVSKTEVFLSAAGQSVLNVGKGAASVVTDPAGTAKGFGAGVKRFGVNLGRRTQRAVEGDGNADEAPEGGAKQQDDAKNDSAVQSGMKGALGVTGAMRRWAKKLNVDPYTTNPVLRKALEDIGKVDTAGSIATKVVLPVPAAVGMTATVGDLVWGKDPEEVRKINEQRLRELGVSDPIARQLFTSSVFTLTAQTRLVAALHATRAKGSADYVESAVAAKTAREALFFVESAELLRAWHARSPVTAVLTDSRALVALTSGKRAVVLLPLDWLRWTVKSADVLREIGSRASHELGASGMDLVLTGKATERMTRTLGQLGYTLVPAPGPGR
jgi:hypothetical protein